MLGLGLLTAVACSEKSDDGFVETTPVVRAADPPPPIMGGTLLVTSTGRLAVAADPSRDLVHVVDLGSNQETAVVQLEEGARPFRLAESAPDRVHVTLRGTGEVVTIDPGSGEVVDRARACGNPRGIAFREAYAELVVGCAGGWVVRLDAQTLDEVSRTEVAPDLRDVFLDGDDIFVTRFRSAEVYRVEDGGSSVLEAEIPWLDSRGTSVAPSTAWRTVAKPKGGWVMLHQYASTRPIALGNRPADDLPAGTTTPRSGYGAGSGPIPCQAVTGPAVTMALSNGELRSSGIISNLALAVDVAVDGAGKTIAIATPSQVEPPEAPGDPEGVGAVKMRLVEFSGTSTTRCASQTVLRGEHEFVAVDFDEQANLVAQTRRDPKLVRFDGDEIVATIPLTGGVITDTGHDLFHLDAGDGISCASCHPEGGDDGRVWSFFKLGPRRTQPLNVRLEGSEPFHWAGDIHDIGHLVDEVRTERMGGLRQSDERAQALADWLFSLTPPPPVRSGADDLAQEGEGVFQELGCQACHSGSTFTNNGSADFGRGQLQVPSLLGVALRPPYMHDGRSADLAAATRDMVLWTQAERGITNDEVDAVVAYLETL